MCFMAHLESEGQLGQSASLFYVARRDVHILHGEGQICGPVTMDALPDDVLTMSCQ